MTTPTIPEEVVERAMDKHDELARSIVRVACYYCPVRFDTLTNTIAAALRQSASEAAEKATAVWRPMSEAPQDGRWIIAVCNDRETIKRVSWGSGRDGEMWWCSGDASYGDGLFHGWINCPQPPIATAIEKEPG